MIGRSGRGGVDGAFCEAEEQSYLFFCDECFDGGRRHTVHQAARRSRIFSSCLPFPFLPRLLCIKDKHYSRINLGVLCRTMVLNLGWQPRALAKPQGFSASSRIKCSDKPIGSEWKRVVAAVGHSLHKCTRPFAPLRVLPSYLSFILLLSGLAISSLQHVYRFRMSDGRCMPHTLQRRATGWRHAGLQREVP